MLASDVRDKKVVVLLSGGMDSSIVLALCMKEARQVHCLFFNYGQKHLIQEWGAAQDVARLFQSIVRMIKIPHDVFDGHTSLTNFAVPVPTEMPKEGLPLSFIPGRNLVFLSMATAFACSVDYDCIAIGASQVDYSGYPDCREDFLTAMQFAIMRAVDRSLYIYAPLLGLTKAGSLRLLSNHEYGAIKEISYSCYEGRSEPCGVCLACQLRNKAFKEIEDVVQD